MQQTPQKSPVRMPHRASFTQTFSSSQQEKEEKFVLDKLLARGITQNKSSIILQQQQQGSIFASDLPLENDQQISSVVFGYRNRYDKAKNETLAVQHRITNCKQELSRLNQQHEALIRHKRQTEKQYHSTVNKFDELSYEVQQLTLRLDNSKNIEDRLKKDIIYYRKSIFDQNLQLMKKRSELRRFDSKSDRQNKLSVRCKTLLKTVEQTLNKNQSSRRYGLDNVKIAVGCKHESVIKTRERQQFLQRSMMEALSQKLPQQKQLMKLLHANKFVKRLFHSKMQRLMSQYDEVNISFSKIKQNTSVKNVDDFVLRFLKKNDIYGGLLSSISSLQPEIQKLQLQNKQIHKAEDNLLEQKQQIQQMYKHIEKKSMIEALSQVEKLSTKLEEVNKFRNSLTNWAISTVAMFRSVPRNEVRMQYEYLGTLLGDTLRMILKYLDANEEKEKSIAQQVLEKQIAKTKMQPGQLLRRNIRIKTLGNQTINREQQDVDYDLISEKDYMHMARRAIKKQYYLQNKAMRQ